MPAHRLSTAPALRDLGWGQTLREQRIEHRWRPPVRGDGEHHVGERSGSPCLLEGAGDVLAPRAVRLVVLQVLAEPGERALPVHDRPAARCLEARPCGLQPLQLGVGVTVGRAGGGHEGAQVGRVCRTLPAAIAAGRVRTLPCVEGRRQRLRGDRRGRGFVVRDELPQRYCHPRDAATGRLDESVALCFSLLPRIVVADPLTFLHGLATHCIDVISEVGEDPGELAPVLGLDHRGFLEPLRVGPGEVLQTSRHRPGTLARAGRHPRYAAHCSTLTRPPRRT